MFIMERMAYESRLRTKPPEWKCFISLFTVILCIGVSRNLFSIVVFGYMTLGCIFLSGTPANKFFKLCVVPITFLILGVFTIALQIQGERTGLCSIPVFGYYLCFTQQGLERALNIFLKSMSCVSCFYFLCLTTPTSDLIGVLYRIHAPKIFVEIMALTYRFIFTMLETLEHMKLSQKSRLANLSKKTALVSASILASAVFVRSFKRAGDIMNAMEVRGYDQTMPYEKNRIPFTRGEIAFLWCYVAVTLVLAAGSRWWHAFY